jgi:hypothetical protein
MHVTRCSGGSLHTKWFVDKTEVTAIHFGSATINQTYMSKHYHGGGCGS